jgi:hypothetical protein
MILTSFILIKMDISKPTVKNKYTYKLLKYISEENYEPRCRKSI